MGTSRPASKQPAGRQPVGGGAGGGQLAFCLLLLGGAASLRSWIFGPTVAIQGANFLGSASGHGFARDFRTPRFGPSFALLGFESLRSLNSFSHGR